MKKLIAICLMLMLVVASASAAEWPEGLSPSRPSMGVGEVDLTEKLGYMMFYPNAKEQISVHGTKLLIIYLPREDVRAGDGHLTLISDDRGEEWSVAFNNTEFVNVRPMVEDELNSLIWGSGTCFEITLPVSLRLGCTYNIDMDRGCIIADVGKGIVNDESKSVATRAFTMETDYGVSELSYQFEVGDDTYENRTGSAVAGDRLRFDLVLGGAAKSATVVSWSNGAISFENGNYFTESCEVTGEVFADDPEWSVYFWDVETPPATQDEMNQHLLCYLDF